MYKNLKNILSGNFKYFLLSSIFMLISSLDGIASPYFLGEITNIINQQEYNLLYQLLITWGFSLTLIIVSLILDNYFFAKLVEQSNLNLKSRTFENSYTLFGKKKKNAEYTTAILSDIKEIENNFLLSIKGMIFCLFQSLMTLTFLLFINWKVGLIFVGLGVFPTLIPKLTTGWLQNSTLEWQKANRKYVNVLEDGLMGRKLVERYQIKDIIFNRVRYFLQNLEKTYLFMKFNQSTSSKLISIVYTWSIVIGFIICIDLVKKGEVNAGVLLTAYMASDRVTTPLISIAQFYNQVLTASPILDKLYDKSFEDQIKTKNLFANQLPLMKIVDLKYNIGRNNLFNHITFEIEQGDKILIKGPSGSGKSTLLNLLLNEENYFHGKIIYQKDYFSKGIYQKIACIDQNPFIFNETLLFNLSFGQDISQEDILEALRLVGLEYLANEDSLSEILGKNGRKLSNGEEKRIELARALLSKKSILFVDEVLSGLDDRRAKQIHELIINNFETVVDVEHHIPQVYQNRYNKLIEL